MIYQLVVVLAAFFVPVATIIGMEFFSNYSNLIHVAITVVLFALIFAPLLNKYDQHFAFTASRITDRNLRIQKFLRDIKKILRVRFIFSISFGLISFILFQWNDMLTTIFTN